MFIDACCTSVAHAKILQNNKYGFEGVILEVAANAKANVGLSRKDETGMVATRRTVTIPPRNVSFDQVKQSLIAAREECDVVVLSGDNEQFLKRLLETESRLFDVLKVNLETISALKVPVVRQLVKQGILFEIQVSQLLHGETRGKCLTNARHLIRTFVRRSKRVVNLIVSSGASSIIGLRTTEEMQAISMLLGLRELDAKASISSSVEMLLERAAARRRKYFDTKEKAATKQTLSSYKKRLTDSAFDEARKKVAMWNA